MADAESFAALLRAFREDAGLSQEELAERAGLSSHAVSALERGTRTRPYPHTIRALSEALGAGEEGRARLIASVPARRRGGAPARDAAPARGRELPVPPTPLLGRDAEVARIGGLLREHRLVTLTGTGGVGKTRLALAVAASVRDRYADGVAFVELAPLQDPTQVVPAITDAVEAVDPGSASAGATPLAERLRDQQVLLVLDNAEHLLAAAPEVAALVEAAPGLTVLVTSRAPLRVRGEVEVAIDPLALPGEAAGPEGDPAAVRLLLDRAGAVRPGWGDGPGDRAAVEAICVRLAGIPLALELAAARSRLLDPALLLERLDSALQAGARDLPERQRTMGATLDWSYGLLEPEEQALLRLLSVFAGGFRLDDLEGVAGGLGVGPGDVLIRLEALAEHSLVVDEQRTGGARHRLLEPVAQYARGRAEEAGEWDALVAAHAAHYRWLAEETEPHHRDGDQVQALARVDAEHANLSAAIERSLAAGDASTAARLCWALWKYWWLRGHTTHGRRLSESVLAQDPPPAVLARAALAAATMTFALDDLPAARRWWELAESAAGDDLVARANAVAGLGLAELAQGRLDEARARFEVAREPGTAAGPEGEWTVALSWIWSGTVALLEGDPDLAVEQVEQGLASARRRGDRLSSYIALYNLSQAELARQRLDRARAHLEEGIRLSLETGDLANLAYLLDATAVLEASDGVHARVPLLLGAAQGIREAVGSRGYGYYQPDPAARAHAEAEARRHLGADRYDDALDTGRDLAPERAAALALGASVAG